MKGKKSSGGMRTFSGPLVDGPERAPSRAMLHAVGFQPDDFRKPQIGIASTWSQVTPCNMHIDELAREAAEGANEAGGKAVIFNTITISDGISMGTEGMKYSLVSREVIADSIETVAACEGFDALVTLGGCDKNMPACVMAMLRLNRPSVFVYGGTILPGCLYNKNLDIVSVFEAVGQRAKGKINDEQLGQIERCAIPGPGSCGGMYTANTMACAIEAMGLSLPNSSAMAAVSPEKRADSKAAGRAAYAVLELGLRPRDIVTRKAMENAITVITALGGSTNAVLHFLAIAHTAGIKLEIEDFNKIGKRVPVLADLKPSGRFVMGGTGQDRRAGAADEAVTGEGAAPWRLSDGDGQDGGGEFAELRGLSCRAGDHPAVQRSHQEDGAFGDSAGKFGPGWGGGEDQRQGGRAVRGHSQGVRGGRGSDGGNFGGQDCERGCGGDPVRGAARGAGDAGDAGTDERDHGRGAG